MSYYVMRILRGDPTLKLGYTGPIRSKRQAQREVDAWSAAGWNAQLLNSTPEVRRAVRCWQRERNEAHGRNRT